MINHRGFGPKDRFRTQAEANDLIKRLRYADKAEHYGSNDPEQIKRAQREEFEEMRRQAADVRAAKQQVREQEQALTSAGENVLEQVILEGKIENMLREQGVREEVIAQLPTVRRLTTGVPAPLISQQPLTSISGQVVPDALEKRILTTDHVVPGTDQSFVTYLKDPNEVDAPLVANLVDSVITDPATRATLFGANQFGEPMPGNEHVAGVALKAMTGDSVQFEPHGIGHVDFAATIDGLTQGVDAQVRGMNNSNRGVLNMQLVTDARIPRYAGNDLQQHKRLIQEAMDDYIDKNQSSGVDPSIKTVLDAAAYNGVLQSDYGVYENQYGGRKFAGKALRPGYDQVLYSTVPGDVAKNNTKFDGFPLAQAVDALHLLDHGGSVIREPIGDRKLLIKQNTGGQGRKRDVSSKIELQVPESRAINVMDVPAYAHASQLLRQLPYA